MNKNSNDKRAPDSPEVMQEIIDISLAIDEEEALAATSKYYPVVDFLARPTVVGDENIPPAPCLFIGNHSAFAFDVSVIVPALRRATGRFVRGMADRLFFTDPKVRHYMACRGCVMANPDIGDAHLAAGKDLLLFPGGSYEATKNISQRYEVMWKDRTGFVRLAARNGVPIVPFGVVGAEEWYGRYVDREDLPDSVLGKAMKLLGASDEFMHSDSAPSIPKGIFGTILPKPEPIFISFGAPVETAKFKGRKMSQARQNAVRDEVKAGVEKCIAEMLLLRARSKGSDSLIRKILTV